MKLSDWRKIVEKHAPKEIDPQKTITMLQFVNEIAKEEIQKLSSH